MVPGDELHAVGGVEANDRHLRHAALERRVHAPVGEVLELALHDVGQSDDDPIDERGDQGDSRGQLHVAQSSRPRGPQALAGMAVSRRDLAAVRWQQIVDILGEDSLSRAPHRTRTDRRSGLMIEIIAGIAGGIGLFFVGMWLLTENLRGLASRRLRMIAHRWTENGLSGFSWGALAGTVTQNSTALTFILVSMLRSGLISTRGALIVLIGALLTFAVQSVIVVCVVGVSVATLGVIMIDQTIMLIYGSVLGASVTLLVLSAGLIGRARQVAMYQVLVNGLSSPVLVLLFVIEIYFDISLLKSLAF